MIGYSIFSLQKISKIRSTAADRAKRFRSLSKIKSKRKATCIESFLHKGILSLLQEGIILKMLSLKAIFWFVESMFYFR